jgi:hypothetical protein
MVALCKEGKITSCVWNLSGRYPSLAVAIAVRPAGEKYLKQKKVE